MDLGDAVREMAGVPLFKSALERLLYLYEEWRELKEREEELLSEINEILSKHGLVRGSLVYKWVLNKAGKKYWYWYLHVREGDRTRSIYVGKQVPDHLVEGLAARRRLRQLQRQLRGIAERRLELEERISRAFL